MAFEESQIISFFKNQTLFLTGGSGFLGKVLLEKLLRECEDIKKIYVLMRSKKGKTSEERFEELFNYPCFDGLKSKNENALKKVSLMIGDCQKPFLGLGEQDIDILKKETTCVIHAAANVKFEQTLKEATYNVRATKDLLELSKEMENLKVFVYVSTAYSNCLHPHIKEKFYDPPMTAENLFALVDAVEDDILEAITPKILGPWPNTYVYTKNITEDLIRRTSEELPMAIVRPSIVTSALTEPIPGWVDNFYGLAGIVAGGALGVIRSIHAKPDARAVVVPVDCVSNCILAAAWKKNKCRTTTIYNQVGSQYEELTWAYILKRGKTLLWSAVSEKVVWYPFYNIRENKIWNKICVFFLHTVLAYIVDFVLFCLGKPTIAVKNYQRLNRMLDLISYFATREWSFDDNNVQALWNDMNELDKKLFHFDLSYMKSPEWEAYGLDCLLGGRQFLLKESIDTLPNARRKFMILFVLHYTVVALLYYLLYKLVMFLLRLFL